MSEVNETAAPEITPQQEAEELQKLIVQGMPTDTEMRTGIPRTVQRHINWERNNRTRIVRYNELRRMLPKLPSIEALRLP